MTKWRTHIASWYLSLKSHTLRICNSYCCCTANMIEIKHLRVTLSLHFLASLLMKSFKILLPNIILIVIFCTVLTDYGEDSLAPCPYCSAPAYIAPTLTPRSALSGIILQNSHSIKYTAHTTKRCHQTISISIRICHIGWAYGNLACDTV